MILKLGRKLTEIVKEKIRQCKGSPTFRVPGQGQAFTRDRKLTAERILSMIITPAKQSLQARLKEFGVKFMNGEYATKQAFSKQRQFINPEYIREYYDETVVEMVENGGLETFKGMHLTAIDGMRVACENTPELIAEFGCSGSKKDACTALASAAYDVLEHISYDVQIGSYSLSERELLGRHLDRLEGFGPEKFLIIADRGYPSYDLIERLIDRGFNFLLRLGENWKNVISWLDDVVEKDFDYEHNGKTYRFRALKIDLGDNKYEYLITNLDRATLSLEEAKHLYALRWEVETFFGLVKTELEFENFSGKKVNAVLQEFYATMTLANICLCFVNDADHAIAMQDNKKRVYEHQANRRQSIGQIVPVFLECIFTDNKRKRDRLWKDVEQFCERFSEPIRPGRNPERKVPRKKKFHANGRKPNLS